MASELSHLTTAMTIAVGAVGTAVGGVGAWIVKLRSAKHEDVRALTQSLETLAERNSQLIEEADRRWHEQREREHQRWEQERQERREHLDELERLRGVVHQLESRVAELERRLSSAHHDIVRLLEHLRQHGVERPAGLSPEAPGNGKKEQAPCDTL